MIFKSKTQFDIFLKSEFLKKLGFGSQGTCYLDSRNGYVYKVFYQYYDSEDEIIYSKDEIVKYNDVVNSTYVWNTDVIIVDNKIVGCVTKYADGKSLYTIDPLTVSLSKFSKSIGKTYGDIKTISNNGIKSYDVMYNILYGQNGFKVIDTQEFYESDVDSTMLETINMDNFNAEIMYFLIDGLFDEFIIDNKELRELYLSKGTNALEFIKLFRLKLSEYMDKDITKLLNAKNALNKRKKCHNSYLRQL